MSGFCGAEASALSVFSTAPDVTDFSYCFQSAVLSLLPDAILVVLATFRVGFWLKRKASGQPLRWHHLLNQALAAIAVALAIARAVRSSTSGPNGDYFGTSGKLGSAVHVLALAAVFAVLRAEHSRSFRPSTLLLTYWPVAAVVDAVRLRSLSVSQSAPPVESHLLIVLAAAELAVLVVQFVLECLTHAVEQGTNRNARPSPTGSNVNVFSRLTFSYMQSIMSRGKKVTLTADDMWNPTPKQTSQNLLKILDTAWAGVGDGKHKLLRTALKAFWPLWVVGGFEALVAILCSYLQPILFVHLLDAVSSSDTPVWIGCLLAILMTLSSLVASILNVQSWTNCFFTGYQFRAAVNAAVYRKSFRLSAAARQKTSGGQITNHMAMDTGRIMNFMQSSHVWWSVPLSTLIGIVLLWQQLGVASLAGLAVIVAIVPLQGAMGRIYERLFSKKMKLADARISLIDETINNIRTLKYYGWVAIFADRVFTARKKELGALRSLAFYNSADLVLTAISPGLVTLVSLATYIAIHPDAAMEPARVFVSVSLFSLIAATIAETSSFFTSGMASWTSLKRLENFLLLDELDPHAVSAWAASDAAAIVVEGATFKWDAEKEPILNDVSLTVSKGAIVAVVGSVGGGKSSLLSALLGEMIRVDGKCSIAEGATIAYVPQAAWIQNATLRENILFGQEYNERKYKKIIDACALTRDLELFEAGDATEIGEKGINLSGGQKQRVALARAVYADADIYLLDDPLSALDQTVARHVWTRVLGPRGVLATKTRVLVTHHLGPLAQTDRIVVLEQGHTVEAGAFEDLIAQSGSFARMYQTLQVSNQTEEKADEIEADAQPDSSPASTLALESSDDDNDEEAAPGQVKVTEVEGKPAVIVHSTVDKADVKPATSAAGNDGKLTTKETSATGAVKYGHYIAYLKATGVFWSIVALLMACIAQGILISTNVVLSVWSDNMSEEHPTRSNGFYLGVYAGIVAAAGVTVGTAYAMLYAKQGIKGGRVLHARMCKAVLAAPTRWFDETPVGRINNRFSGDIGSIDEALVATYVQFLYAALSTISILVIISIVNPMFMIALLPLGIAYYSLQNYYLQSSRELKRLTMMSSSPVYSAASACLSAASVVRAFRRQHAFQASLQTFLDRNQSAFLTMLCANKWMQVRSEGLGAVVVFGASLLAVLRRDHVSAGTAGLTVSYAMQITMSLMSLLRLYGEVQNQSVAIERVVEYTDLPAENDKGAAAARGASPATVAPSSWPATGAIEFADVEMRYRPGAPLVLKKLTLSIGGGEKIGVVGRTGAGKSSLAAALFRMADLDGGRICIDGVEISDLPLATLRSRVTLIPQDPGLFSGPLRLNLDPAGKASDADLWAALAAVHMKDKILKLAAAGDGATSGTGLDYIVESGGGNFSVGEKQLLCLSRAILRNSKILLLDEATSGMDRTTDELVQRAVRENFASATVITVAHRIETILDYDRVLVLDAGTVAEFDDPKTLLADKTSAFWALKNAHNAAEKEELEHEA
ncbi:Canalicular multispecific organic anion transporter 2 [Geranomyces michiganensis]|nr:Canalicular multispecific organic anion transporter 2 [Geranomyces michiganensis]